MGAPKASPCPKHETQALSTTNTIPSRFIQFSSLLDVAAQIPRTSPPMAVLWAHDRTLCCTRVARIGSSGALELTEISDEQQECRNPRLIRNAIADRLSGIEHPLLDITKP
jgi:hypothetical protein